MPININSVGDNLVKSQTKDDGFPLKAGEECTI